MTNNVDPDLISALEQAEIDPSLNDSSRRSSEMSFLGKINESLVDTFNKLTRSVDDSIDESEISRESRSEEHTKSIKSNDMVVKSLTSYALSVTGLTATVNRLKLVLNGFGGMLKELGNNIKDNTAAMVGVVATGLGVNTTLNNLGSSMQYGYGTKQYGEAGPVGMNSETGQDKWRRLSTIDTSNLFLEAFHGKLANISYYFDKSIDEVDQVARAFTTNLALNLKDTKKITESAFLMSEALGLDMDKLSGIYETLITADYTVTQVDKAFDNIYGYQRQAIENIKTIQVAQGVEEDLINRRLITQKEYNTGLFESFEMLKDQNISVEQLNRTYAKTVEHLQLIGIGGAAAAQHAKEISEGLYGGGGTNLDRTVGFKVGEQIFESLQKIPGIAGAADSDSIFKILKKQAESAGRSDAVTFKNLKLQSDLLYLMQQDGGRSPDALVELASRENINILSELTGKESDRFSDIKVALEILNGQITSTNKELFKKMTGRDDAFTNYLAADMKTKQLEQGSKFNIDNYLKEFSNQVTTPGEKKEEAKMVDKWRDRLITYLESEKTFSRWIDNFGQTLNTIMVNMTAQIGVILGGLAVGIGAIFMYWKKIFKGLRTFFTIQNMRRLGATIVNAGRSFHQWIRKSARYLNMVMRGSPRDRAVLARRDSLANARRRRETQEFRSNFRNISESERISGSGRQRISANPGAQAGLDQAGRREQSIRERQEEVRINRRNRTITGPEARQQNRELTRQSRLAREHRRMLSQSRGGRFRRGMSGAGNAVFGGLSAVGSLMGMNTGFLDRGMDAADSISTQYGSETRRERGRRRGRTAVNIGRRAGRAGNQAMELALQMSFTGLYRTIASSFVGKLGLIGIFSYIGWSIGQWIGNKINGVISDELKDTIGGTVSGMIERFTNFFDWIVEKVDSVLGGAKKIINKTLEYIENPEKMVEDVTMGAKKMAKDAATSITMPVTNAMEATSNWWGSLFNDTPISVPKSQGVSNATNNMTGTGVSDISSSTGTLTLKIPNFTKTVRDSVSQSESMDLYPVTGNR